MSLQTVHDRPKPPSPRGRVDRLTAIPVEMAAEFLEVYRAAFAPLEKLAAARQSLTNDEFLEEMVDPSVVKFVARDAEGNAVGLAFMATDLTKVPWISVPFFEAQFPDHMARQAVFYFGAMLVRPD